MFLFPLWTGPMWANGSADDKRTYAYLSDTATMKEPAAISVYRAKDGPASVREFEELARIYSAIVDIKALSGLDRRYWKYALTVAHGRLANAYRWVGDDAKSRDSAGKAIEYSRAALNKPLTSPRDVEQFIAGLDRNLEKP